LRGGKGHGGGCQAEGERKKKGPRKGDDQNILSKPQEIKAGDSTVRRKKKTRVGGRGCEKTGLDPFLLGRGGGFGEGEWG